MLPAGSSHNTRFTLCRYWRIIAIRPSSNTGRTTTHGAWRTVAISNGRPSFSVIFSTSTANTRVVQTIAMNLLRQLVEHLLQVVRQRARELHAPLLGGMRECQPQRVQERSLQVRDRPQVARHASMHAAVDRIADDGMADLAEVYADLMRAPGVDRDVRQGQHHAEFLRLDDARDGFAAAARF